MDYKLNLLTPPLYSVEGENNCKDELVQKFAEYVKHRADNEFYLKCKYDPIPGLAYIHSFEDFEERFLIHSEYAVIIASPTSQKALSRFIPRLLVFLTAKPIWQNRFIFVTLGDVDILSNLVVNDPIRFSIDQWETHDEDRWIELFDLIKITWRPHVDVEESQTIEDIHLDLPQIPSQIKDEVTDEHDGVRRKHHTYKTENDNVNEYINRSTQGPVVTVEKLRYLFSEKEMKIPITEKKEAATNTILQTKSYTDSGKETDIDTIDSRIVPRIETEVIVTSDNIDDQNNIHIQNISSEHRLNKIELSQDLTESQIIIQDINEKTLSSEVSEKDEETSKRLLSTNNSDTVEFPDSNFQMQNLNNSCSSQFEDIDKRKFCTSNEANINNGNDKLKYMSSDGNNFIPERSFDEVTIDKDYQALGVDSVTQDFGQLDSSLGNLNETDYKTCSPSENRKERNETDLYSNDQNTVLERTKFGKVTEQMQEKNEIQSEIEQEKVSDNCQICDEMVTKSIFTMNINQNVNSVTNENFSENIPGVDSFISEEKCYTSLVNKDVSKIITEREESERQLNEATPNLMNAVDECYLSLHVENENHKKSIVTQEEDIVNTVINHQKDSEANVTQSNEKILSGKDDSLSKEIELESEAQYTTDIHRKSEILRGLETPDHGIKSTADNESKDNFATEFSKQDLKVDKSHCDSNHMMEKTDQNGEDTDQRKDTNDDSMNTKLTGIIENLVTDSDQMEQNIQSTNIISDKYSSNKFQGKNFYTDEKASEDCLTTENIQETVLRHDNFEESHESDKYITNATDMSQTEELLNEQSYLEKTNVTGPLKTNLKDHQMITTYPPQFHESVCDIQRSKIHDDLFMGKTNQDDSAISDEHLPIITQGRELSNYQDDYELHLSNKNSENRKESEIENKTNDQFNVEEKTLQESLGENSEEYKHEKENVDSVDRYKGPTIYSKNNIDIIKKQDETEKGTDETIKVESEEEVDENIEKTNEIFEEEMYATDEQHIDIDENKSENNRDSITKTDSDDNDESNVQKTTQDLSTVIKDKLNSLGTNDIESIEKKDEIKRGIDEAVEVEFKDKFERSEKMKSKIFKEDVDENIEKTSAICEKKMDVTVEKHNDIDENKSENNRDSITKKDTDNNNDNKIIWSKLYLFPGSVWRNLLSKEQHEKSKMEAHKIKKSSFCVKYFQSPWCVFLLFVAGTVASPYWATTSKGLWQDLIWRSIVMDTISSAVLSEEAVNRRFAIMSPSSQKI